MAFKGTGFYDVETVRPKTCVVCDTPFVPRSGANKFCSDKCRGKWKYITGDGSTDNQYRKISGNWERYFSRLIGRGMRRDSLTRDDLLALLEAQGGRCALSGVKLTCRLEKGKRFLTNASIDRIEAGGPYIPENIQLVCAALNGFRRDTPLDEFIWWCKKVAENAD